MAKIYIATGDVLSTFDEEHLFFVFEKGEGENIERFILRGGPEIMGMPDIFLQGPPPAGYLKLEVNVPIGDSMDTFLPGEEAAHDLTPLDLGGRDAETVWNEMLSFANSLSNSLVVDSDGTTRVLTELGYDPITNNCNSFASSVLSSVGIDIQTQMPMQEGIGARLDYSSFFGHDYLFSGDTGDTLKGYGGDDEMYGNGGDDILDGGTDDDEIYGGDNNDIISGGADNDHLYGNNGNDILIGGTGDDDLYGGANADTFGFMRGDGVDTIHDYNANDLDVLQFGNINFEDVTFARSGDNLITTINGSNNHVTVKNFFDGTTIFSEDLLALNVKAANFSGMISINAANGAQVSELAINEDMAFELPKIEIPGDFTTYVTEPTIIFNDEYHVYNFSSDNTYVTTDGIYDFISGCSGDGNYIYGGGSDQNFISGYTGNNNYIVGAENSENYFSGITGDSNYIAGGDNYNSIKITGNSNYISGGTGSNRVEAIGNSNYISGGDGGDSIDVIGDRNYISGGAERDLISVTGNYNYIDSGAGDDLFGVSGNKNYISGGSNNNEDHFSIDEYNNILYAGTGDDSISVSGNKNYISGGSNDDDDLFIVRGDENEIHGGSGSNHFNMNGNNNTFYSGTGDEAVYLGYGGNNNNNISNNNTFIIGADSKGDGHYSSYSDTTTIDYSDTKLGINLDGSTVEGEEIGTDTIHSINNIVGGSGNDTFENYYISSGTMTISGGDGDDTFINRYGGDSHKIFLGDSGNDTYIIRLFGGGHQTITDSSGVDKLILSDIPDAKYLHVDQNGDDIVLRWIDYDGKDEGNIWYRSSLTITNGAITGDAPMMMSRSMSFSSVNSLAMVESEAPVASSIQFIELAGLEGETISIPMAAVVRAVNNGGVIDLSANEEPIAVDDNYAADLTADVSGNVLDNDTDPDGDTLALDAQTIVTSAGGSVELNADGTFSYHADDFYEGDDSFTYTANDGNGGEASATVNLSGLVGDLVAPELTLATDTFSANVGEVITSHLYAADTPDYPEAEEKHSHGKHHHGKHHSSKITDQNGVDQDNLTLEKDFDVNIKFVSEDAKHENSIGVYTVGENGEISNVHLLEGNTDNTFSSGDTLSNLGTVASGTELGFFIIDDGFKNNDGYEDFDPALGHFEFVNKHAHHDHHGHGKGHDKHRGHGHDKHDELELVFVNDATGRTSKVDGEVHHATNNSLNGKDLIHTVSGLNEEGNIEIGFEDSKNLGDRDFNDLVIEVEFASNVVHTLDPVQLIPDAIIEDPHDYLISSASIDFAAGQQDGDVLTFDASLLDGTNITATTELDGSVTLSGDDSASNYQLALQSVSYASEAADPADGTREFDLTITNDHDLSTSATISLDVANVDLQPLTAPPVAGSDPLAAADEYMPVLDDDHGHKHGHGHDHGHKLDIADVLMDDDDLAFEFAGGGAPHEPGNDNGLLPFYSNDDNQPDHLDIDIAALAVQHG